MQTTNSGPEQALVPRGVRLHQENERNMWNFMTTLTGEEGRLAQPLLNSPWPIIGLTVSYIVFVCFLGPAMMRKRQAYSLKRLIRFYNLAEMVLAAILFVRMWNAIGSPLKLLQCSHLFSLNDGQLDKVWLMSNFILFVRTSEYLDTIFFTLRKKQNQISFLHVYHHAFVPIYAYWVLRSAPTRYNNFILLINSFTHIIMYFYYFVATFQHRIMNKQHPSSASSRSTGSETSPRSWSLIDHLIAKVLRFKKYMTLLQISQFVILFFYSLWPLAGQYLQQDGQACAQVPARYILSNLYVAISFLGLFLHFYLKSYGSGSSSSSQKSLSNGHLISNKNL